MKTYPALNKRLFFSEIKSCQFIKSKSRYSGMVWVTGKRREHQPNTID